MVEEQSERKTVDRTERKRGPGVAVALLCCASFLQGVVANGLIASVITTMERRFDILSSQSAAIVSSYHVGSLVGLPFLSYIGGRHRRKPLWIGWGMFAFGAGAALLALPYFTAPPARHRSLQPICSGAGAVGPDEACGSSGVRHYLYFFVFVNLFNGVATVPLFSLGVAYIHDIAQPGRSSLYHGLFFSFATLGAAGGYFVGGLTLRIDSTSKPDSASVDASTGGAWWVGYLAVGVVTCLTSVPLILLPSPDVPAAPSDHQGETAPSSSVESSWAAVAKAVRVVLGNPLFVLVSLVSALDFFSFTGINTFLAKYIEAVFNVAQTQAAIYVGVLVVFGAVGGQIMGGFIGSRVSDVASILKIIIVFTLLATAASCIFLYKRPSQLVAGGNVEYRTYPANGSRSTTECHASCGCSYELFLPVCGSDNLTYFTPCHAGCRGTEVVEGTMCYTNCSCLHGDDGTAPGSATPGRCGESATAPRLVQTLVMALLFLVFFCAFMGKVLQIQIVLRSVADPGLRSFAIGIQWMFVRMFGTIPGPLVYGRVTDLACIRWSTECGSRGACRFYDIGAFSDSLFFVVTAERALNVLLLVASLIFHSYAGCSRDENRTPARPSTHPHLQIASSDMTT